MTQSRVHAEVEEMLEAKNSSSSNIHRLCMNSFNLASMSALLQALFNGLISDEVCEENDLDGGHWKNMSVDEVIELWFDSNRSAKGKDKKSSPPPPSLVLFVFDFETVDKQTLLTLILLLKEHIHRAAISMVFFLASSHNARSMQYYLPAQATDHLAFEELEPFYEPALIPRLLEALVVDEALHFRLHPTMLRQLAAHTTNYEFTFASFFLLLKSLVFEHFYADPLSVVCQEPRSLKATLMKSGLAAAGSSKSRQSLLPLLQNSLPLAAAAAESDQADEDSSADTEDGGDNDKAYIGRLTAQLEELHSQHARFTLALQIVIDLLQCAHCLPVKSTQNTTRSSSSTTAAAAAAAVKISSTAFLDHYCDAVTEPAYNFEEGGLLSELLERLSESSAKLALKRLLAKYRDEEDVEEETDELVALLAEYQTKLTELQRQEAEEEARQQADSKKLGLEIDMVRSVTVVKEKLRAVQSRTEWRQTLSAQKKTKAKAKQNLLLPFEQWKTELVGALAEALRAASPATRRRHRLLAEALFARAAVERHFREVHCVCTRDRLARTLSQTGGGGGGGTGSSGSGSRSHSFATCYPNSFILYQLYREAAPVVNLADWYEQFGEEKRRQGQQQQQQVQPGSSKKGGKEAAAAAAGEALSADELTVHFSTTLSDFDYIGLLQSSRYKADYLNRLAWF